MDFTLPPDDPNVNSELPPTGRELGGFTCLIGLNGSGKSTLLQAFDFIAHVATGKVTDWLERREWKNGELVSNFGIKTRVISFEIRLRNNVGADITWSARFNTNSNSLKCTTETIISAGNTILDLKDGSLMVTKNDDSKPYKFSKIPFEYEGSVLSTLKLPDAHPGIAETKSELEHLCSLELFSPQLMRKKARLSQDIGAGGEKLSSFQQKWKSIEDGFKSEEFEYGVPMVPNPKSEAWLICALKPNPYQNCAKLETSLPGTDGAPRSAKDILKELLSRKGKAVSDLADMITDGMINPSQITMPSFDRFKVRLEDVTRRMLSFPNK